MYVYILKCSDDTLYTGYAVDLKSRIKKHNSKLGAKYTRGRIPVTLLYFEKLESKSECLKREKELKKLSRSKKLELIEKFNKKILLEFKEGDNDV